MSIKALSDKVVIVREADGTIGVDIDETKIIHQRLGGVGKNNHSTIDDHVSSNLNPHSAQAKQVGAVSDSDKDKPHGVAGLDKDGKVVEVVIPQSIARYSDLADHRNATNNPHEVNAKQIGALSESLLGVPDGIPALDGGGRIPHDQLPKDLVRTGSLKDHSNLIGNPHKVTAKHIGAVPSHEKGRPGGVVPLGLDGRVDDGFLSTSVAKDAELQGHISDNGNPHKLNSTSVGAVSARSVGVPDGVAPLNKSGFVPDHVLASNVVREDRIDKHESNNSNPHRINPQQIGAVSVGRVGARGGVASLDEQGLLKERHVPGYLARVDDIENHSGRSDNPHGVLAEQVGALSVDCVNKPGGVPLLTEGGFIPDTFLSSAVVTESRLREHTNNHTNPHNVVAEQVGAIPVDLAGAPNGIATLNSKGDLNEGQIPVTLVRRSDLNEHFNASNPHKICPEDVQYDEPIWNAGKLNNLSLPERGPLDKQILRWSEDRQSFVYDHESMVGEVNQSANVGYGHPLAVGKQDSCLLFRTISATKSALVSLSTDDEDNHETIWVDVNEHNLDHNNIKNRGHRKHTEIDSHLDSTGNPHKVTPEQVGNTVSQWNANKLLGREISTQRPGDGQVLKWDARAARWVPSNEAASEAESNDAMNVGARGVGVFKRKKDAVLEFKKLLSVSNKIVLKEDERNSVITLSLNEDTIVHDKLSGSGKNNHADIDKHINQRSNPHNVTPGQLGCEKPEWNANKLNGVFIDTSEIQDGDVLIYSSKDNKFVPCDVTEIVRQAVVEYHK